MVKRCEEETRSFGYIKLQDWCYHIERWMGNIKQAASGRAARDGKGKELKAKRTDKSLSLMDHRDVKTKARGR